MKPLGRFRLVAFFLAGFVNYLAGWILVHAGGQALAWGVILCAASCSVVTLLSVDQMIRAAALRQEEIDRAIHAAMVEMERGHNHQIRRLVGSTEKVATILERMVAQKRSEP